MLGHPAYFLNTRYLTKTRVNSLLRVYMRNRALCAEAAAHCGSCGRLRHARAQHIALAVAWPERRAHAVPRADAVRAWRRA